MRPLRAVVRDWAPVALLVSLALQVGSAWVVACVRAREPRPVVVLAEAVRALDLTCASLARERRDAELARQCADAYDDARTELELADGDAGGSACAVARGVAALERLAVIVRDAGGARSALVDDARRVVAAACDGGAS